MFRCLTLLSLLAGVAHAQSDPDAPALEAPPEEVEAEESEAPTTQKRRQEVRLVGGELEVLLPEGAPPERTPAWLWLDSGRLEGKDRPQPVPRRRAWPVALLGCEAGVDARCVRVTGLGDLRDDAGRFDATLHLADKPVAELTLYVEPSAAVLWGWLLGGLLASFIVTTLSGRVIERLHRRRRLNRLLARLGASREDHPPLLARIQCLLELVRIGLRRKLVGADPVAIDRYLDEAEQLLALAEAKTRVWQRARSLLVPPSLAAQINGELRLFDGEVLQLDLPMTPEAIAALQIPSLRRAEVLVESAALSFPKDLAAALHDALSPPEPASLTEGDTPSVAAALLLDQIERERARLSQLDACAGDERSPLQLREIDLRLTVLRTAREVLARGEGALAELDLTRVTEAVNAWRTLQDLTDAAADRVFEELIFALRWQPENSRFQSWLEAYLKSGVLRVETEDTWQTFTPCPVRVELAAPQTRYAEAFLWRRLLQVEWTAKRVEGGPTGDVRVIGKRGAAKGSVAVQGPESTAYSTRGGRYLLEARIRPHDGAEWHAAPTPVPISVISGPEQSVSVAIGLLSDVRLSLKLLATLLAGLLLIEEARRDPRGYATYTGLFYAAVGAAIDLGTTALPRSIAAVAAALRALFGGRARGTA